MKNKETGGILIMTLVLVIMIMVIMMASSAFISTRYHQTVNQSQREQSYDLAEAGIYYAVWLLNVKGTEPEELTPVTDYPINDPTTHQPVGTFTLTFETSENGSTRTVKVTSVGKHATLTDVDQRVVATLSSTNGSVFKVKTWNQAL